MTYLALPFGFPSDTAIASRSVFLSSDFDCVLYVAFISGLWQKTPKLIDDISTRRLHIQILPLETAAFVHEAPQRDAGATFRDPTAILLVAPVPGLGVRRLCHSKMLSKVLLKEDTHACACCLPLLALAELPGISQSGGRVFPMCWSWLLDGAGRCLQEM